MGVATSVLSPPLTPAYINITTDGDTVQRQGGNLVDIPIDFCFGGRLGLDSNYIPIADLAGKLVLNWNAGGPCGNRLAVFDGTSTWNKFKQTSQLTIKATDTAQTGGTLAGDKITITGLTTTRQLVPGMTVNNSTGTGTITGQTIATIVSATSITVSNTGGTNVAGTLTNLTFKLPALSAWDVILVNDAGTLYLLWGPKWTTPAAPGTRASSITTQDGINVNSGSWTTGWTNGSASVPTNTGVYLGSVYVDTTAGQLNDSGGFAAAGNACLRFVWNNYNRRVRGMQFLTQTASWSYKSTTWRQWEGTTTDQLRFFAGLAEDAVYASSTIFATCGAGDTFYNAIGLNWTSGNPTVNGNPTIWATQQVAAGAGSEESSSMSAIAALGLNTVIPLEANTGANTFTFYGISTGNVQSGLVGSFPA